jgi:hypothetical protein
LDKEKVTAPVPAVGKVPEAPLTAIVIAGELPTAPASVGAFLAKENDEQAGASILLKMMNINHADRKAWNIDHNIDILLFDRHCPLLVLVFVAKNTLTRRAVAVNSPTLNYVEPNF